MIETQKLRKYREHHGVKAGELARELRITRQSVFTMETKTEHAHEKTAIDYLEGVERIVARRESRDPHDVEIVSYVLIGGETPEPFL